MPDEPLTKRSALDVGQKVMDEIANFARRMVAIHRANHPEDDAAINETARRGSFDVRIIDLLGPHPRIELVGRIDGREYSVGYIELRRIEKRDLN